MFKARLNDVELRFGLVPVTPFLVKSGDHGGLMEPGRADMQPLLTRAPDGTPTVFLPGSTLKGVVRSAAERILRSLPHPQACNPLDENGRCHQEAGRRGDRLARFGRGPWRMGEVYRMLCFACRTFGSQAIASRVRFADSLPTPETREAANRTERRSGVAIDRKTGGPARGKLFELDVVTGGRFAAVVHMENVQLWQVALLGLALADVDLGLVRIGSGKTRGFGSFRVHWESVRFRQAGSGEAPAGVAALAPELVEPYGLLTPDHLTALPAGGDRQERAGFTTFLWAGRDVKSFFAAVEGEPWRAVASRKGGAHAE